jgi:hypothetical protein
METQICISVLELSKAQVFNVVDFGAKGDGIT